MNELISLHQITICRDGSISPGNELLLKVTLIDSVESISTLINGHKHFYSEITVGLCSANPKTYEIYENASEIAEKIDKLK